MLRLKKDYWDVRSPLMINSAFFQDITDSKLVIVDGGAAGELVPPFNTIQENVMFVRFEARGEDSIIIDNDLYINGGLWSEDGTEVLHIAARETTSSIYPPNISYLSKFDERYGAPPRETKCKIPINVRSVGSAVKQGEMPKPNFIKLDIHSAEFEAVVGSEQVLEENIGFLIETWHSEVHIGQHLHGELEAKLYDLGYELYDLREAAAWRHMFENETSQLDRRKYIGSEALFLRREIPEELLLKYIAICDIFGYTKHVMEVLSQSDLSESQLILSRYKKLVKTKYLRWLMNGGVFIEAKNFLRKILGRYNP